MPCFQLRLSISHLFIDQIQQQDLCGLRFRTQTNRDILAATRSFCSSSIVRASSLRTLEICTDIHEKIGIENSSSKQASIEEVLSAMSASESDTLEDLKETQRRERIGVANKGKVPWNKGKKHSAETRERIRQRTIEALNDPKVREKRMAKPPRFLSDQVKNKIGSSQRRVWAKRLKLKRSREKLYSLWSESIAESAKTGGPGQKIIHWDNFNQICQEIPHIDFDLAIEKPKAKELARVRREEDRVLKVLQLENRVCKRKSLEEKKKQKEEVATAKRKAKQERQDSRRRLKLKEKLTRIRQKITDHSQVPNNIEDKALSHRSDWENFDIELIKKESSQREEVSLADQIVAAKKKRAELATMEALASSFTVASFSPKP